MSKVLYEKDGRIARITLNRPKVMIVTERPRLGQHFYRQRLS